MSPYDTTKNLDKCTAGGTANVWRSWDIPSIMALPICVLQGNGAANAHLKKSMDRTVMNSSQRVLLGIHHGRDHDFFKMVFY